jgi:hypothetical protein
MTHAYGPFLIFCAALISSTQQPSTLDKVQYPANEDVIKAS